MIQHSAQITIQPGAAAIGFVPIVGVTFRVIGWAVMNVAVEGNDIFFNAVND